ncbi:MAG: TonB-dependent receptor [Asticcacaulis sp.]|nr:TonB-dependent receptor [Asticcacaulis sp.]
MLGTAALPLIVASLLTGFTPAQAQDDHTGQAAATGAVAGPKDDGQGTDKDSTIVVVTGTNIKGVKPVGSETTTLKREDILATGLTNVTDVLRTLPQVQNVGDPNGATMREGGTAGYGGNSTQGTTINLRGIGSSATLTLVDGHRLAPSGAAQTFTEATQVPIAAVERIAIVSDGASAIYGSDAVSGVINFELRKHYNGAEVTGRYSVNKGADEKGVSITAGQSWNDIGKMGEGNVIFSVDFTDRSAFARSKSPYLRQDLRQFGGLDNRINGATATPGIPGNIVVTKTTTFPVFGTTYSTYGLPNGPNDHLTGADLLASPNLVDSADYADYIGALKRQQYVFILNQSITPWLDFSYEGFYTHRETVSRSLYTNSAIKLTAASPFYIQGVPGLAPGADETIQYNFYKDIGAQTTYNPDATWTQTASLKAQLPNNWSADAYATFGRDATCGICNIGNNVDLDAFNYQIAHGTINPLSAAPLTNAQKATFIGTNIQSSSNNMADFGLKFTGPLFRLPAGQIRLAVGAEHQFNEQHLANGANRGTDNHFQWDNITRSNRTVDSAYLEVFIPLVSRDMNIPLVQDINLDIAGRYDKYSDFGETSNPKIGMTWDVNDQLSLRGSWGTSFRAPSLTDTNANVFSYAGIFPWPNNSGDPNIHQAFPGYSYALMFIGANPDLQPEEATTWSAGFDYKPDWLDGLSVGSTYYDIAYDNQIVFSPSTSLFLASPQYRAIYSKYIHAVNNTGCVEGNPATYDQQLAAYLALPNLYGSTVGQACQVQVILDGRETNMASTHQYGVDLHASYFRNTPAGFLNFGGSVTKILSSKQTIVDGSNPVRATDHIFYPVSLRGRFNAGWAKNGWNVNLFANYVGGYLNDQTLSDSGVRRPFQKVKANTTYDLGVGYMVPKDSSSFAKGVRVSFNIQNVFNQAPQVVLTNNSAFDAANSSILGRVVRLQLTKAF